MHENVEAQKHKGDSKGAVRAGGTRPLGSEFRILSQIRSFLQMAGDRQEVRAWGGTWRELRLRCAAQRLNVYSPYDVTATARLVTICRHTKSLQ